MSIQTLRDQMPDYAKDTQLNLAKWVSGEEVEGLSIHQAYGVALAAAYATKHDDLIHAVSEQVSGILEGEAVHAAKAAATIMGMNNVYYRFVHLSSDKSYQTMPPGLRMNIIRNPGVDQIDFELMSLAVSALNGCGMCIDAHVQQVLKGGISQQGVLSCIRIASVLNAAAQVLAIESSNSNLAAGAASK